MATETVTLSRELADQIRLALETAVDATVAIQDICKTEDDGLPHGCVYAIKACLSKQEDLICPTLYALHGALEISHAILTEAA